MNIIHEQYIGIYENAFSEEYCNAVINYFDEMAKAGNTLNRQQIDETSKSMKEDTFVNFCNTTELIAKNTSLVWQFNDILWKQCYADYTNKFWSIKDFPNHGSFSFKIQKTEPSQGYHHWHCESGSVENSRRILVWTLYLNDVNEGGETEFIFQQMRIKPKMGTLVLFPASFTHTHRGNPPLSNIKYIVTGWIEF